MNWAIIALVFFLLTGPAEHPSLPPGSVTGLVAHYDAASLHASERDGKTWSRWPDASGEGHDLVAVWVGSPPALNTQKLDGKPVVTLRRGAYFDVEDPFELDDHTIFLVFGSDYTKVALFRSDADSRFGVLLHDGGRSHVFQKGKAGSVSFNEPRELDRGYGIVVLGREGESLHAFINGSDASSGNTLTTPVRVGRFFELQHTTFVTSDGEGLRIAEMIFYDRFLSGGERAGVTRHLSERYGIEIVSEEPVRRVVDHEGELLFDSAAAIVRLGVEGDLDVNRGTVPIAWNTTDRVEAPFRVDPDGAPTEIHCTQDGTRVRLSVLLPLTSEIEGARVRALLLKNGTDYHSEEADTGAFERDGEIWRGEIRFRTELTLDAGEFVELVTSQAGAPGIVRLEPDRALFLIEPIE